MTEFDASFLAGCRSGRVLPSPPGELAGSDIQKASFVENSTIARRRGIRGLRTARSILATPLLQAIEQIKAVTEFAIQHRFVAHYLCESRFIRKEELFKFRPPQLIGQPRGDDNDDWTRY